MPKTNFELLVLDGIVLDGCDFYLKWGDWEKKWHLEQQLPEPIKAFLGNLKQTLNASF